MSRLNKLAKCYGNNYLSPLRNCDNIDYSVLNNYISEYYSSKEEFIVDILIEEISFLHEFSIFGHNLIEISKRIAYTNSRQFTVLLPCLSSIFKNRFYTNPFEKLNSKFTQILIDNLKNKRIPFDCNTSKTLTNIIENLSDLTYSDKKTIIFSYANDCTGIISGNVTLESYNLPFKFILTKDDYEELLEYVYVGNNAIKI